MSVVSSKNNIIIGNTIRSKKNAAILLTDCTTIQDGVMRKSEGNFIAYNKLLGYEDVEYTQINIGNKNNTVIQPELTETSLGLYSTVESLKDLELYFPFVEDAGDFRDYSSNGITGIVQGTLNRKKGIFGNALQFDGKPANYIEMNHNIGSYDATYFLVFRTNALDTLPFLVYCSWVKDSGRYYMLSLQRNEDAPHSNVGVRFYDNGIGDWTQYESRVQVFSTEVIKLAVTFKENASGIDVAFYADGQLKDSTTMPGKPSLSSNIISIGSDTEDEMNTFDGDLHVFKAWSRTLTAEEIQQETFATNIHSSFGFSSAVDQK